MKFRFSLRISLLIIAVFAIWFAYMTNNARRQSLAVSKIRQAGGVIYYDWMRLPVYDASGKIDYFKVTQDTNYISGPRWLRKLLGDDYFQRVYSIGNLHPADFNEELIAAIGRLPKVDAIDLVDDLNTEDALSRANIDKLKARLQAVSRATVFGPFTGH